MPDEVMVGAKKSFYRWLILAGLMFCLVDLGLHWNSMRDKANIMDNQEKLNLQQAQIETLLRQQLEFDSENGKMLRARARLQINVFNAVRDGRRFTAAEVEQIEQLWHQAQYTDIQDRFERPLRQTDPSQ